MIQMSLFMKRFAACKKLQQASLRHALHTGRTAGGVLLPTAADQARNQQHMAMQTKFAGEELELVETSVGAWELHTGRTPLLEVPVEKRDQTRAEVRDYFNKTWDMTDRLFDIFNTLKIKRMHEIM